jgi:hypothetical protein
MTRALVILALLCPLVARADNKADTLKKQGVAAAQRKDWGRARELFEQSYNLDPRPLTLYNLAAAQEHTAHLVQARASYQTFLDLTKSGTNDEFRAAATAALQKLQTAIPTVRVRATGFTADTRITVDDHAVSVTDPIALDPGTHTFTAIRGIDVVATKQLALSAGAREELELTAPPLPPPVPLRPPPDREPERPPPPPPPPPAHERGVLASPWFWVIASTVVAGAAAGGAYYYHQTHASDPSRGTLGGTIAAP